MIMSITWLFLFFINLSLFDCVVSIHCSNHSPENNLPSSNNAASRSIGGPTVSGDQDEDILNQQSNSNDQTVVNRGVSHILDNRNEGIESNSPSLGEGASIGNYSSQNQSSIPNKFISNIQSNVNKLLQPIALNMDNILKINKPLTPLKPYGGF